MGKRMTATEVARNFSNVLDMVERGESVEIYRGKKLVGVLSAPTQAPDVIERMREAFGGPDPLTPEERAESDAFWAEVLNQRYAPENMQFREIDWGHDD